MGDKTRELLHLLKEIRRTDGVTTEHLREAASLRPGFQVRRTGFPAVTTAAIASWKRFEDGKPLRPADVARLESIVLPNGLRPAFFVENDSYGNLPTLWEELNQRRGTMESLIKGIGRLDLKGHPSKTHVGTAFVCGEKLLMTNRHVAQQFVERSDDGLFFSPGVSPFVDLKEESNSSATKVVNVVEPSKILENWDIAILKVDALPGDIHPLPLSKEKPTSVDREGLAAIIGYPEFDPSEDIGGQIQIFQGAFGKKRLQPGRMKGMQKVESFGKEVTALTHDCTTLGGNSGSALIDVSAGKVVGIHFAGKSRVANFAVPSWALAADPALNSLGVNFS